MSGNPRLLVDGARYLSRADCEALSKRILSYSTSDGARVVISSGNRGNTRFAVNQVSTAGDNYNASVSIVCSFGKRTGTVNTNRLDETSLREAVRSAETLAKLSPEDPEALPELESQQYAESLGWSEATASLDPARRSGATREISDAARAAGLVATGYAETIAGATAVGNSRGLFAYGRQTQLAFTTTVRTPDGTGSGWAGTAGHDWGQVNAKALASRAIEKAKRSVNPVAIEPGRYTVILEPTAVGNLVQLLAFSMSARSADEGRSFFSKPGGGTKIGLKVVDERVTLVSDPADREAYALPFAQDGTPLARTTWIENGLVKNLSYDRYWAQKQGKVPTPVPATLRMSGDDSASIEDLIESTERGVLVTRFWYIRPVDPRTILFTGLTRDGTFLIENGKISKAVKNLRFNESPVFMLNNLEKMGKPERVSASESGGAGTAIVVPPIKIHDFNFTSLSDAI
ncbi:MAG: TldD/PmbA family protein [Gemmatimonadaceae bacterium]